MRVAFIHPFLYRYPRGIERYTINLANALAQTGVEAHILTWRWPQPIQIDTLAPMVRVHVMPTSRYYAAKAVVPFYVWELLRQRFDFVWIFFAGYGEAAALRMLPQQRFGVVFHYPFEEVPHRYAEFRRYDLIDHAAQVVSVSQLVADGVREQLGRTSAVIHHGVDTQRFAPDPQARAKVRRSLNIGLDTPLIVTAAALEERKGVQRVLYALPDIRRALPNITYAILGDGPYRATLERMAGDLGVADCVHFLGAQANIAPFYQAADLSAILAHGEASSLVALESLACGVPVIAADWRPFDELIDGDVGIRIPADDARQVARATADLLRNPDRRRAMGERGRARILKDFQWDQVASQYNQLLDLDRRTPALAPGQGELR